MGDCEFARTATQLERCFRQLTRRRSSANYGLGLSTAASSDGFVEGELASLLCDTFAKSDPAARVSQMDPSREAGHLSAKFIAAYAKREVEAAEHNARLDDPTNPLRPSKRLRVMWTAKALIGRSGKTQASNGDLSSNERSQGRSSTFGTRRASFENEWRHRSGRKSASIVWSLNDTMTGFWAGGLFKVLGDTATLMSPLLSKALIKYADSGESASKILPTHTRIVLTRRSLYGTPWRPSCA